MDLPGVNKHYLHPSLAHPLMREWNSVDMFRKRDLVLPLFVHLDSENLTQEIPMLPDVY
jgi:delta-aminolevulinic acid dehydratase/porphobilinogen synthase